MKSWADHCSSDEESFNEDTPLDAFDDDDDDAEKEPVPAAVEAKLESLQVAVAADDDEAAAPAPESAEPRVYDLPSGPPFTVFVGNLSYGIKDGRVFDFISRTTPTAGTDYNIISGLMHTLENSRMGIPGM